MPISPSLHAPASDQAASAVADPSRLAEHGQHCAAARGRLHRVRCAAEAVHGFLAPRLITSLAVVLVVVGLLMLLLPGSAAAA
jgi:hypothetical protein